MKLTVNHVSKSYGKTRALIDFCADLEPGIYALLGPNGSGKSTLMNIITDNLASDAGDITYADGDGNPEDIAREVIMLKKGRIVDNAPPHELTRKIEGKVRQTTVRPEEVGEMQTRFRVVNIQNGDDGVLLRILAEGKPTETASNAAPTLEDYYLWVFGDIL